MTRVIWMLTRASNESSRRLKLDKPTRRKNWTPVLVGDFSVIVKLHELSFEALMLTLLRGETATCSGHVTTGPGSAEYTRDNTTDTVMDGGNYQYIMYLCANIIT